MCDELEYLASQVGWAPYLLWASVNERLLYKKLLQEIFEVAEAIPESVQSAVHVLEGEIQGRNFGLDDAKTGREVIGSSLKRGQLLGAYF
jgi:hypothetical protein